MTAPSNFPANRDRLSKMVSPLLIPPNGGKFRLRGVVFLLVCRAKVEMMSCFAPQ